MCWHYSDGTAPGSLRQIQTVMTSAGQLAGLLKRAAEGQQDVAEVSTALQIVLQGQEELD